MSVFKALREVVYYPDGPQSRRVAKAGEAITLLDDLDYIVGTQINPEHVEKLDLSKVLNAEPADETPAPKRGRKAAE